MILNLLHLCTDSLNIGLSSPEGEAHVSFSDQILFPQFSFLLMQQLLNAFMHFL